MPVIQLEQEITEGLARYWFLPTIGPPTHPVSPLGRYVAWIMPALTSTPVICCKLPFRQILESERADFPPPGATQTAGLMARIFCTCKGR